jgi:hypothetical protein
MNDTNIDSNLSFPHYQAPLVQTDPRLQKALMKFIKQKMPRRSNHKMTRRPFSKKKSKVV